MPWAHPQRFYSDWGDLTLPVVPPIQPDLRTASVAEGMRDQGECLPESWPEHLGDLLVPLVGWESPGNRFWRRKYGFCSGQTAGITCKQGRQVGSR